MIILALIVAIIIAMRAHSLGRKDLMAAIVIASALAVYLTAVGLGYYGFLLIAAFLSGAVFAVTKPGQ